MYSTKNSFYQSDGSGKHATDISYFVGRDHYISYNSGGIWRDQKATCAQTSGKNQGSDA